MKLVSIILSFRNEEESIPEMIDRLEAALGAQPEDYEIIYVNDDSTDRSVELLKERNARNPRVKVVNLSRRFGVEPAIFAGLAYASGDAVITIDADLQDPPELIPDLVKLWREEKADLVYTVRTAREGEPWLKMFLTNIAYVLIQKMADVHIPLNAGDFRLMDRRVVTQLLQLTEPNSFLRGLVQWVGFKRVPYYYVRKGRGAGVTHFSPWSKGPVGTLLYGVTGFSAIPVYAIGALGMAAQLITDLWLLWMAVATLFGSGASATSWLTALDFWRWSVVILSIGVVGLYVVRTFRIALNRPRYVVDNAIGFEPREQQVVE